jgi:hypothetical protein
MGTQDILIQLARPIRGSIFFSLLAGLFPSENGPCEASLTQGCLLAWPPCES